MKYCRFLFGFMSSSRKSLAALAVLAVIFAAPCVYATGEERFPTPDDALNALKTAAAAGDTNAMNTIFGPANHELISPDVVQASMAFRKFSTNLLEKVEMLHQSDTSITLQIGTNAWPFPIPLVQKDGQWNFDTEAGKNEILNRRVGRDEIDTISVCRAYVDAQREYASVDRNGDGVLEYAQHLRSTPGLHDGLYWHSNPGEEISPLGPLIAQAHQEGYGGQNKIMTDGYAPYHGYYYKILTKQGKHAPIGKYNYIINGHMIGGFALVAWPAEWGNTGVMTFIVNQQGIVYQKNLGPKTASIAARMTCYDPDDTWTPVQEY